MQAVSLLEQCKCGELLTPGEQAEWHRELCYFMWEGGTKYLIAKIPKQGSHPTSIQRAKCRKCSGWWSVHLLHKTRYWSARISSRELPDGTLEETFIPVEVDRDICPMCIREINGQPMRGTLI